MPEGGIVRTVEVPGCRLAVAVTGSGPAVLLLHGWPHTWQVWSAVVPALAATHTVIAPDLRGLGASEHVAGPYDGGTVAGDLHALLDRLEVPDAAVMALDASVPAAFLLGMQHPERVRALVLMESLLMPLPGAESFLTAGPPWWFGFHAVAGLAETVLVGHEAEYVDFFLTAGTHRNRGIEPAVRDAFVAAYRGTEALRCGFEYYRAGPTNAALVAAAPAGGRQLEVPPLALGGPAGGGAGTGRRRTGS